MKLQARISWTLSILGMFVCAAGIAASRSTRVFRTTRNLSPVSGNSWIPSSALRPIGSPAPYSASKISSDIQEELQALITQFPTDVSRARQDQLINSWVGKDAAAAALFVEQMPVGSFRTDSLLSLARSWSNLDFAAASQWARQLSHPDDRVNAITSMVYEAAGHSPMAALRLAEELPRDSARDALFHYAARQWAAQDGAQAGDWASRLGDTKLRTSLLGDIAVSWSDSDPVAALSMAMDAIPSGRVHDDTVVGIVQRWTQQDATQAAEWVERFPEGAVRDAAVENLVRLWTETEWEGPARWLGGLRAGPLRDCAVESFVRGVAPLEPAVALAWAATISDTSRRERSSELAMGKVRLAVP